MGNKSDADILSEQLSKLKQLPKKVIEQNSAARDQENASRTALGMEPLSESLSGLYSLLFTQGPFRPGRGGSRDVVQNEVAAREISRLNEADRGAFDLTNQEQPQNQPIAPPREGSRQVPITPTGTSTGDALPPKRVPGTGPILTRPEPVTNTPGLSTAINTLTRDINQPLSEHQQPGEDGVEFQSGGAANTEKIEASQRLLESIAGLGPGEKAKGPGAPQALKEATGSSTRKRVDKKIDKNTDAQNFRDTLVANSNQAQRQVQSINQSILTGRRARRGSSVSLPTAGSRAGQGSSRDNSLLPGLALLDPKRKRLL